MARYELEDLDAIRVAVEDIWKDGGDSIVPVIAEVTAMSQSKVRRLLTHLVANGDVDYHAVGRGLQRHYFPGPNHPRNDRIREAARDASKRAKQAAAPKVTAKERAMLEAIVDSEYQNGAREKSDVVENPVWSFSVCDGFGAGAGGIASSLSKKGFARFLRSDENDDSSTIAITETGWDALVASGWHPNGGAIERGEKS
jgi:hypothetical protein